jgi:hypothetical protein
MAAVQTCSKPPFVVQAHTLCAARSRMLLLDFGVVAGSRRATFLHAQVYLMCGPGWNLVLAFDVGAMRFSGVGVRVNSMRTN